MSNWPHFSSSTQQNPRPLTYQRSPVPMLNPTSSFPAVRECVSHWSHCSSSSQWTPTLLCATSGHLPHPHNSSLYLRCQGPGYAACVCRCQYTGMCFDQHTRRCVFPDTFPDTNCQVIKSLSPSQPMNKPETNVNANDILKETRLSLNIQNSNTTIPGHGNTSVSGYGIHAGELYSHQPEAMRQVTDMENLILEDNSLIPAWAMALLACCAVIIAMLIVLLLYWCPNGVYMSSGHFLSPYSLVYSICHCQKEPLLSLLWGEAIVDSQYVAVNIGMVHWETDIQTKYMQSGPCKIGPFWNKSTFW